MSNNFWHPNLERCGFILKDGSVIEVENESKTPNITFSISPEVIEKTGLQNIDFFWHSHPSGDVNLTMDDYFSFLKYPDHKHRIYNETTFAQYSVRRDFVMREEL